MLKRQHLPQFTNMERRMIARMRAQWGRDYAAPHLKIRDRLDAQRHPWPSEAYELRQLRRRRQGKA